MVALMAPKASNGDDRKRLVPLAMAVAGLCTFFYLLGGGGKTCPVVVTDGDLGYDMATLETASAETGASSNVFEPCDSHLTDYTPCQDQRRALRFSRDHYAYRERHCPRNDEMLRCLIPPPPGYKYPFPWPESRQYAWFANAPHKHLAVEKAVQNWIRLKGDKFFFPGGGTTFPDGADVYLKQLATLIPLADGSIRTALDTGCGVASFGAYMFDYNVVTMSFAPRDTHEAQVQFAIERGVPAVLGIMATRRQPYPSSAFDLIHCSRCLIPWTADDGLYLKEVDRMLRPGGYWVLSGPPVNWQKRWRGWDGTQETFEKNMTDIEDLAAKLCWTVAVKAGDPGSGDFAVFQKPLTRDCYATLQPEGLCPPAEDPNVAWETPMKSCISEPTANVTEYPKWPQRLTVPPVRLNEISGLSPQAFETHNRLWRERLAYYKRVALGELKERKRKIRNIMDMNAGYGGLAAALALDDEAVWVMNVVPSHIVNTLPIIYDRGLAGTYMNWCEAFSTYPRTYDLIHAAGLFGLYSGRCDVIDILLEMDRILRPEGLVIIRDEQRIVGTVSKIARGLRWEVAVVDTEQGSTEKLLVCHKKYWVSS